MPKNSWGKPSLHTLILLLLLFAQFLASFNPHALAWDGVFYYIYTRSTICDGDLKLDNDLALSYEATSSRDFAAKHFEKNLTPTGRVANPFAVGTSLLWLPWFAFIYGLTRLAGVVGLGPNTLTCYEWPFVWGMATVTCIYGWIGILTGFRLAKKFVGSRAALLASATTMLTNPLCYYQFREPFYAHAASAMTTALFITTWWRHTKREKINSTSIILLGALGGLAALVRSQNITYIVLPGLTALFRAWPALRKRNWKGVWRSLRYALLIGLGMLLVLTVQFTVWHIFYGQPLTVPQGKAFIDWRAPWIRHVLFSTFHGLLPWMPLTLPAVIGLVLLARRVPKLSIPLLIAFLLQVYVNGCARDWFGAGGYGPRRFSNALIVLLIGYAATLDWRKERWYRLSTSALSALLILHQWLILRYGFVDLVGGRVISMAPDYKWQADSIAAFAQQLIAYIPSAVQNPAQTLILPGSPLETARTSSPLFARQIFLLIGMLGTAYLLKASWRCLANRQARSKDRFLLACVVFLTSLAVWWLLKCA